MTYKGRFLRVYIKCDRMKRKEKKYKIGLLDPFLDLRLVGRLDLQLKQTPNDVASTFGPTV